MIEQLKRELEATFKGVSVTSEADRRITVVVDPLQALALLRFFKDRGFSHLALLSAVDLIDKHAFELVYVLTSYVEDTGEDAVPGELILVVKSMIPRDKPTFKSVISIYPNAEPYEREIHELFGIHFDGHPRLTPLFLERQYPIPPFRKDFDTRRYVEDVFGSIPAIGDEEG